MLYYCIVIIEYIIIQLISPKSKKFEFYVEKLNRPKCSCSDQSDLNAPDVVTMTCELVSTNVPGGLEHSNRVYDDVMY